jgi:pilus assembly protein CpaE
MDTMIVEPPVQIAATAPIAAGRLPLMAFVDAESERILQESAGLLGRCVIMRGGVAKAIEYLSAQRSPNLLIVDISGVDMPLMQIQNLAEVCEPGTSVVAIGNHNDVGLYRDLVDIGVSNYIVKPLTRELLTKAITPQRKGNVTDLGKSILKLGKVISLVGARGGVGTTTLAANFAWQLANRQSRRVALVDLDLQHGDCSMLFNIPTNSGFRDALSNPLRLDHLLLDRIMTKVGDRLFVLGSEEALQEDVNISSAAIDALFGVLRSQFHYVLVDVPRIQAPAYRRALEMADRRVIVVDQTMRSMRDAKRVAKLFDDLSERRNMFVVNRVGEAGSYGLTARDIHGVLQSKPTAMIPFLPKLMAPAAHQGVLAASQRSKFSTALTALTVELSDRKQGRNWRWWRAK